MRKAKQVVILLLGLAVFLTLFVVVVYAFHLATHHTSLYNASADINQKTYVQIVRESTNIDALKRVCEMWAENEDQSREVIMSFTRLSNVIMERLTIALVLFGVTFSSGLLYVYIALRRAETD